jgi:hypothetical protein
LNTLLLQLAVAVATFQADQQAAVALADYEMDR